MDLFDMIDNMESDPRNYPTERILNWVRFPENRPLKKDYYIVTIKQGNNQSATVLQAYYEYDNWYSVAINECITHLVTAYMELPEPYYG